MDGSPPSLAHDPMLRFQDWLAEAEKSEPNDPNALCLATATPDGRPSARMVLLKGVDPRGFVFYTNLESRKGGELAANPWASMCFHWKTQRRQVRVEGPVEPVTADEADAYYASRPLLSRLGAWASRQSRPLAARAELEASLKATKARFPGEDVPRPPHWSGFRLVPRVIEFWTDMPFRLHDRSVFRRDAEAAPWSEGKLFP